MVGNGVASWRGERLVCCTTVIRMQPERMILLVEDELPVRKLVSEMLHRAGYAVVSASSGQDAIQAFNNWRQSIHLLITDLDLAGTMSGVDVAEQLVALRPDLRVLLMSGSPEPPLAFLDNLQFIRKPFTPAQFLHKVKEVLSQEAGLQFRRDCDWIEHLLSRRYPQICIECKEDPGNQYLLRLRRKPDGSPKEVRFSMREYLDGYWEAKIEAAVAGLSERN